MSQLTRISLVIVIIFSLMVVASYAGAFQTKDGKPLLTPPERSIVRNEYGYPILDSSGNRINYSRQQLSDQLAQTKGGSQIAESGISEEPTIAFGAHQVWSYAAFGSGIGKSNIMVAAAQNGDHLEVYLGGSTSTFGSDTYWYALRYSPATSEYVQVYVSHYYPAGISRIEVADIVGDSKKKFWLHWEMVESSSMIKQQNHGLEKELPWLMV